MAEAKQTTHVEIRNVKYSKRQSTKIKSLANKVMWK